MMRHTSIARPRPLIVAHVLLLLGERPRHGYELAESLRMWEFEGITTSTIYRELARLEENGLVRSFWQSSQARGPARHMYELTDAGRVDLAASADDVRELVSHLQEFLARFATLDSRTGAPAPAPEPAADPAPVKLRRRFLRSR